MPRKRMVGRAGHEFYNPANALRQSAGVSGAFDAKGFFGACPAPDPARFPSMGYEGARKPPRPYFPRSLRRSSRAMASRMKAEIWPSPATASMRDKTPRGMRSVVFTVSASLVKGGRPMSRNIRGGC